MKPPHKVVDSLARHGVLAGDPVSRKALEHLIERWAQRPLLEDAISAFVHGDANTANFLFPGDTRVVAVDWERAEIADPAQDLGRLAAEVTHAIVQNEGDIAEAETLIDELEAAYSEAMPATWSAEELRTRAVFYRAVSSLRIARNAWLPRWQRTLLVTHALSLLSI